MRRGRPKCLIRKSCVSILDGNLISSLSDGRSDPPGLRNQIWQGLPSCLFEGSEHLYRIKTLLDPWFFFSPWVCFFKLLQTKAGDLPFLFFQQYVCSYLNVEEQNKNRSSPENVRQEKQKYKFFKGGWHRMRQGEGHHKNNDRGGHTKASYHTWSLASSFPNNPHKDSTLPRRFITQRPRTGPGQARDLRLGQLCALTEPHAVSGDIEFPRNVDTYSESSAPETVPLPLHLEPGNITLLCQTVWVHLTRSSCCDLGIMKKPTRG